MLRIFRQPRRQLALTAVILLCAVIAFGLFFADADYFAVGPVDKEQFADYARRRGLEPDELRKVIPDNL